MPMHDDRCAALKGHPCNCPMAAFKDQPLVDGVDFAELELRALASMLPDPAMLPPDVVLVVGGGIHGSMSREAMIAQIADTVICIGRSEYEDRIAEMPIKQIEAIERERTAKPKAPREFIDRHSGQPRSLKETRRAMRRGRR